MTLDDPGGADVITTVSIRGRQGCVVTNVSVEVRGQSDGARSHEPRELSKLAKQGIGFSPGASRRSQPHHHCRPPDCEVIKLC